MPTSYTANADCMATVFVFCYYHYIAIVLLEHFNLTSCSI